MDLAELLAELWRLIGTAGGSEADGTLVLVTTPRSTGPSPWLYIGVPLVAALLGILGGGVLRFLLDRHERRQAAVGFARSVEYELEAIARRLEDGQRGRLPVEAWEAHRADLGAVVLPEEFMALSSTYAVAESLNRSRRHHAADREVLLMTVRSLAMPSIQWLAAGNVPLIKRRRAQQVLDPDPSTICRCGHRFDHHRWTWERRGWWRLRWRRARVRNVAHECNVAGCSCSWFRETRAVHLPRCIQQLGPGNQGPPMSVFPREKPGPIDLGTPDTAQPGERISVVAHDRAHAREAIDVPDDLGS